MPKGFPEPGPKGGRVWVVEREGTGVAVIACGPFTGQVTGKFLAASVGSVAVEPEGSGCAGLKSVIHPSASVGLCERRRLRAASSPARA